MPSGSRAPTSANDVAVPRTMCSRTEYPTAARSNCTDMRPGVPSSAGPSVAVSWSIPGCLHVGYEAVKVEIANRVTPTLPADDDHPYRTGPWQPQFVEYDAYDLDV